MNHRGLRRLAACSLLTLAALAAPAATPPARAGELALEGHAGYFQMAASNSGSALFGSDGGGTFGGAARFTFWRGLFVSAGARSFSKDGERVFVSAPNAPVQKLGFPLSMSTTPITVSLGYRFRNGHTLVPYVSAGAAFTKYKETSSVAGETFDESVSKTGFAGAVGLEVGRGLLRFAAEGGWSSVPNAIGKAGVSRVYGEDDIGGKYAIGKLVLAFGL
jgi:opacity protein-like surface antigen